MNILLCGAAGFVGRHINKALIQAGHRVVPTRSGPARGNDHAVPVNFNTDTRPDTWLPRLRGIDAVVNAVGVLRDTRQRPIQTVHTDTPKALFDACAEAGVRRVIHVSALGIEGSHVAYATTKLAADQHLLGLTAQGRLDGVVLRPSIVFGGGGASSLLFMNLAKLPVLMLPQAMLSARIQPVAVDDLALAVAKLLDGARAYMGVLACVGPTALSMADFIAHLRVQQGHGKPTVLSLPGFMTTLSARIGDQFPALPFCTDTLALLDQDNVAPPQPFADILGRPAVGYQDLVATSWH